VKALLSLTVVLAISAPALAESRSVLLVVTHDKDGKAAVTVHSDDTQDRREAAAVEEACKAVAGMKGWGSVVNVHVVTDRRMSRKDRKALFDAIDANAWLDLASYGPEAPKVLADHFLKPEETGEWQGLEVVAFRDFDDLEVTLGGKKCTAFLVGLQPLGKKDGAEKVRKDVLAKLQKNALWARVVTARGEVVGLSVDTFVHHKNDFGHPWDPKKYPYCWSGWGAYNLNAYFLHAGVTTFKDTFGRNDRYREQFTGVVKALAAPADPAKKPKPAEDEAALAGTWKVTEIELAGNPRPPGANERWVIGDGRIEWERLRPVTFKVTPDATKTPKQIDLEIVEGLGTGGKLKGIYKLTDGKLQVCYFLDPGKDERPSAFAGTDTSGKPLPGNPVFLILRREEKDK
jgi:uncharacterized protein (TIGR03067 family)